MKKQNSIIPVNESIKNERLILRKNTIREQKEISPSTTTDQYILTSQRRPSLFNTTKIKDHFKKSILKNANTKILSKILKIQEDENDKRAKELNNLKEQEKKKPNFLSAIKKRSNIIPTKIKNKFANYKLEESKYDDDYIKHVVSTILLPKKSIENIIFLRNFFKNFPIFAELINKNLNFEPTFDNILNQLKYEYIEMNKILFRFGDLGEKFYIILKGKIDVLVPNLVEEKMTFIEFIEYLNMLKQIGEIDLRDQVIEKNKNVFTNEQILKPFLNDFSVKNSLENILANQFSNEILSHGLFNSNAKKLKKISFTSRISGLSLLDDKDEDNKLLKSPLRRTGQKQIPNVNDKKLREKKIKLIKERVTHFDSTEYLSLFENIKKKASLFSLSNSNNSDMIVDESDSSIDYINNNDNHHKNYNILSNESPKLTGGKSTYKIFKLIKVATLRQGDKFGDLPLLSDSNQRSATCIASEDCELVFLTKQSYHSTLKEAYMKEIKEICDMLKKTSLFNIMFDLKQYVIPFTKKKSFQKGDIITKMFDKPENLYIIIKGEVKLTSNVSLKEGELLIKHYCNTENNDKLPDYYNKMPLNFIEEDNSKEYKAFIEKQHSFTPMIKKQNEILFLDDILIQGSSMFNAIVISDQVDVLYISMSHFNSFILYKDIIKTRVNAIVNLKKPIIAKLLLNCFIQKLSLFDKRLHNSIASKSLTNRSIKSKANNSLSKTNYFNSIKEETSHQNYYTDNFKNSMFKPISLKRERTKKINEDTFMDYLDFTHNSNSKYYQTISNLKSIDNIDTNTITIANDTMCNSVEKLDFISKNTLIPSYN